MHRCIQGIVAAFLFGSSVAAVAAIEDEDFAPRFDAGEVTRRKQPGLFSRPAKDSPEEQLQYAEALHKQGRTRGARKQYSALVHRWHQSREAATAQLRYAELLEQAGKYQHAFDEYQYLIDSFADGFEYEVVLERQLKIANHVRTVRHCRVCGLSGSVGSVDSMAGIIP